jgi:hypothetical protein
MNDSIFFNINTIYILKQSFSSVKKSNSSGKNMKHFGNL